MNKIILILAILFVPVLARAQWTTVATFGQPVSVNSGTWIRYGSVADNLWFYKAYTANKSFTVGTAEYTANPDSKANQATFVIQAFQLPLAANVAPQTITVAGAKVTVPPAGSTIPPTNPAPGTMAYCGSGKATSFTFTGSGSTTNFTSLGIVCN